MKITVNLFAMKKLSHSYSFLKLAFLLIIFSEFDSYASQSETEAPKRAVSRCIDKLFQDGSVSDAIISMGIIISEAKNRNIIALKNSINYNVSQIVESSKSEDSEFVLNESNLAYVREQVTKRVVEQSLSIINMNLFRVSVDQVRGWKSTLFAILHKSFSSTSYNITDKEILEVINSRFNDEASHRIFKSSQINPSEI